MLDSLQEKSIYCQCQADLVSIIYVSVLQALGCNVGNKQDMANFRVSHKAPLPLFITQLSLHIATGSLPRSLLLDLVSNWAGTLPSCKPGQETTTSHAAVQEQAWVYLSADCPVAEITCMPNKHPGRAQLDAIKAGLHMVGCGKYKRCMGEIMRPLVSGVLTTCLQ